jgi:hypothetical protein
MHYEKDSYVREIPNADRFVCGKDTRMIVMPIQEEEEAPKFIVSLLLVL